MGMVQKGRGTHDATDHAMALFGQQRVLERFSFVRWDSHSEMCPCAKSNVVFS